MTYQKINVARTFAGQVLNISLNSPKGNILDAQMMTELMDLVNREASDPALKALVFKGAGDHFSFGASVAEHQKEQVAQMLHTFHQLFLCLAATYLPACAVVRGQCLGGGLELAMYCQWIFASKEAMFGQPEINLGVFPPIASLMLPFRVGQAVADDLILTGQSITAAEAKSIGLINSVSGNPDEALEQFLQTRILSKSSAALRHTVRASRWAMYKDLEQNIKGLESMYLTELMSTHDANEGIRAFLEKRNPVWHNN